MCPSVYPLLYVLLLTFTNFVVMGLAMDLLNASIIEDQSYGGKFAVDAGNFTTSLAIFAVTAVLAHAVLQFIRYYHLRGPRVWPYVGSLYQLLRNSHRLYDWITDLELEYGGTYTAVVPIFPSITATLTCDPQNLEHILKTRFSNYPKGSQFSYTFHELLGGGIFNSDSEPWRVQRKTASHEFSNRAIRDLMVTSVRKSVANRLLPVLEEASGEEQDVDLQDVFLRYTFDNICIVAFGVDPGCLSPGLPDIPFATSFDLVTEATCQRLIQPKWLWRLKRALGIGLEGKLKSALVIVDNFAKQVITMRRKQLGVLPLEQELETKDASLLYPSNILKFKLGAHDSAPKSDPMEVDFQTETSNVPDQNPAFADLLSRFMQLQDSEGRPYSDSFLRDVATNFIIAGRDTSAVALTWFFWLLSKHPDVENKILEELAALMHKRLKESSAAGSESIGKDLLATKLAVEPFTYDELKQMHYLHAALSESLRLYPSVPLDTKYAAEDDTLPDGTKITKGARVVYAIYSMARMPSIWGPDCLDFKPERWFRNGTFNNESPFKFAAFNAGPRLCLGKDMGYLQMKAVSSAVLSNFKVDVDPHHPIEYRVSLTLFMKHGLKVRLRRRSPEELGKLLRIQSC